MHIMHTGSVVEGHSKDDVATDPEVNAFKSLLCLLTLVQDNTKSFFQIKRVFSHTLGGATLYTIWNSIIIGTIRHELLHRSCLVHKLAAV